MRYKKRRETGKRKKKCDIKREEREGGKEKKGGRYKKSRDRCNYA